jgi:hypothetical protein
MEVGGILKKIPLASSFCDEMNMELVQNRSSYEKNIKS